MTELQIGLFALGGTAVVGVFAYNKWQEYRHRKLAEAVFQPHHDDVLLGDAPKPVRKAEAVVRHEPEMRADEAPAPVERIEPMFVDAREEEPVEPLYPDDEPLPVLDEVHPEQEYVAPEADPEPLVESAPTPPAAPAFVRPAASERPPVVEEEMPSQPVPVPAELLDSRLEFIVAMDMVEPVSASQILHSQREYLQRLSKPVHWLGFNERTREWERLPPDSNLPLRRLRVGLQLVNRLGPVSEADFTLFSNAMQALADELMAVAEMPDVRVLDQAAEVDRFCAAVDLEIGINLVSRASAFSGTKIRALAEAAGMVLGIDGLFTRYDEDGRPQFSLQNYETAQFTPDTVRTLSTHGITFLLDVPRVDHGERVFMQMTELAKRFAETLQGALVDDNRQPLSDSQLEHIRREFIGKPQATMASFGLPAGSAQALRLFS